MKRLVLVLVAVVFSFDISYAEMNPSYIGQETIMNRIFNSTSNTVKTGGNAGSMTTHRSAVSSNDATNPALGSGVDCSEYRYALVDFDTAAGTQWTATPLYGNSTASAYMAGSATVVSGDSRLLVDTYGSSDVYIRLTNVSNGGGGAAVTVYVTPVN